MTESGAGGSSLDGSNFEFDSLVVGAARKLLASDAGLDFTIDQLATALDISRATLE